MKIDLMLFDLDGTLIDSREDIANAVNHMLKTFDLRERSREEIVSFIGRGIADLIRNALGKGREEMLEEAMKIFEGYYRKHGTDTSILYPGVIEMLEYFRNKKKAVVTNRNYEFAKSALEKLNIDDFFEDIAGGDDVNCMKPSSCSIETIVNRAKADKKKTIIVGDMDIDIMAGKKAGIFTCAVSYGFGKKEDIERAAPDCIIGSIAELESVIE